MKKTGLIIISLSILLSMSFSQTYILLGWNDLGMHCSNKYFDKMAVLPPYNNVYAQLILKQTNAMPQLLNNGYKIEYTIPGNTFSVGKTDFWTYAQVIFGLQQPLPDNIGLTGKGLTGLLDTAGKYFYAQGIPVTPFSDDNLNTEKPFQLFHLSAKLVSNNTEVAFTDNVIPVSNEIGCVQSGCHSSEQSIKNSHESVTGYDPNAPTLCAKCHASNALGTPGNSEAKPFSYRIHLVHDFITPENDISVCYKCHPGPVTQCFRDPMRIQHNMVCQNCHGTMNQVAISIIPGGRRHWLDEPKCGTCHGSVYGEEPNKLFRQSKGHGGLFCSACHGSPHAVIPSRENNDNLQSIRLQGYAGAIKKCEVCHSFNPGGPGPHGLMWIGVKSVSNEVPENFIMSQNYPNPFNPITKINVDVPNSSYITLKIYDALGREVDKLIDQQLQNGYYEVEFDGSRFGSGIYYYTIIAYNNGSLIKSFIETKKMVMIK